MKDSIGWWLVQKYFASYLFIDKLISDKTMVETESRRYIYLETYEFQEKIYVRGSSKFINTQCSIITSADIEDQNETWDR